MTHRDDNCLQRSLRPSIMRAGVISASLALLCLTARTVWAQDGPAAKPDDLDVTMQIITDPDAKLPDEVVRQIPLPTRKPATAPATDAANSAADAADKGQERAREAQELGREAAERAKERANDAAEQRERATRSMADERRRNPPPEPPRGPPPR